MGHMQIVWDWSLSSEESRIQEMSLKVASGFYHLHHFLPLPYEPKNKRVDTSHHVYLPDLPYATIPRYWESVAKLGNSYPIKQLANIHGLLTKHLASLNLTPLESSPLQSATDLYLPQVISWLKDTFPHLPLPETILIHPSYFGTGGSFFFIRSTKTVELYIRNDQELHSLVEILLTAVLRPHSGDTLYTDWEKSEYLVDYLLLESSLTNLLPKPVAWTPTTLPPHFSQEIIKESQDFLTKIGAPLTSNSRFTIEGNNILFSKTPLNSLTVKEASILKTLITRSPAPATIDELADLIFTNDEKFSLAAISKTIERLRNKLNSLGISSSYLATASGVGYYLKN